MKFPLILRTLVMLSSSAVICNALAFKITGSEYDGLAYPGTFGVYAAFDSSVAPIVLPAGTLTTSSSGTSAPLPWAFYLYPPEIFTNTRVHYAPHPEDDSGYGDYYEWTTGVWSGPTWNDTPMVWFGANIGQKNTMFYSLYGWFSGPDGEISFGDLRAEGDFWRDVFLYTDSSYDDPKHFLSFRGVTIPDDSNTMVLLMISLVAGAVAQNVSRSNKQNTCSAARR